MSNPDNGEKITARLDGWTLKVNVSDLFHGLDDESISTAAQALACEGRVFDAVVDQIIDGMTADGSYTFDSTLNRARARIIAAVDPIACGLLSKSEIERKSAEDELRTVRDRAWAMYHAWRERDIDGLPPEPPRQAAFTEERWQQVRAEHAKARDNAIEALRKARDAKRDDEIDKEGK